MTTLNIKSKLERLAEKAGYIINSTVATDGLKSDLNQIKEDWDSLNGKIDNWKDLNLSANMTEHIEYYERFTLECRTNMQMIKGICEDTLTEINEENEPLNSANDNENINPKESHRSDGWVKFGVVSAIIVGLGAWHGEVRYDQGKEEIRRNYDEFRKNLEYAKDSIMQENLNLRDSLENYKIKTKDLEKIICKLKRTCK